MHVNNNTGLFKPPVIKQQLVTIPYQTKSVLIQIVSTIITERHRKHL